LQHRTGARRSAFDQRLNIGQRVEQEVGLHLCVQQRQSGVGCLTPERGAVEWTSSLPDSPASRFQRAVLRKG
jgi:hypothetical protein